MARIRSIKPEFWSSEQITECSVNARLMFIGMWNFSDDAGRKSASIKRIKMEVFPGDNFSDAQLRSWMNELVSHGLVVEYESQSKVYWQVTGWHHQKIQHPQTSKIPVPFSDDSVIVTVALTPEGNGREGNRSNTSSSRKRDGVYSDQFTNWWAHYPRKIGKSAAAKAYASAAKQVEHERLLEAVIAFAQSPAAKGDHQFIPHPSTWLNEGRYEDDRQEWGPQSRVATEEDLRAWTP